jgi:5-methylcytosine-specific restriction endonuclease McrA
MAGMLMGAQQRFPLRGFMPDRRTRRRHGVRTAQWQCGSSPAVRDGVGHGAIVRLACFRALVLAAAHLDGDPTNNRLANLKTLCQRCHMLHDRPHHLAQH